MLARKSTVLSVGRDLLLLGLFLFGAVEVLAQTPVGVADKRPETNVAVPEQAPIATAAQGVANTAASPLPVDPVRSAAVLMNAGSELPKKEPASSAPAAPCVRNIQADIVAIPQPLMLNRLGTAIPDGLVFALRSDTVGGKGTQLKPEKRPRPIVLRANVGDCLTITFTNSVPTSTFSTTKMPAASTNTTEVSLHVQGVQWVTGPLDDGSFAGKNTSSLATPSPVPSPAPPTAEWPPQTQKYTLFAKDEGTFLLYTMGDTTTNGNQLTRGLFGALNVQPARAEWYRSQVTADDLVKATYNANRLPPNATISAGPCTVAAPCTLTFTGPNARKVKVIKAANGVLSTIDNHPLLNYDATNNGVPILKMLDGKNNLIYSDLTAMITGPNAGRFPGVNGDPNKPDPPCNAENNPKLGSSAKVDPLFCQNPASPDRKQPYREITVIYHGGLGPIATQAFPILQNPADNATQAEKDLAAMTQAGQDAFAINYGTGGIGAEIYANRIGVGPMGNCVDCKFEEFFLSAWTVGDPAMLVDVPANTNISSLPPTPPAPVVPPPPPLCTTAQFGDTTPPPAPTAGCANAHTPTTGFPYTLVGLNKATRVYYPDDPSNVFHSYINDHVKFRILHGGRDVTHVHHQHAHQWLQSPNSDESSYLDSQMISPGASYTLEMVYNGSGNRNKVVGDSIFHCHFYPHFAAGMWAMWRTHDVFESGSLLKNGIPIQGTRALPDGEISAGSPNPAIVPLPTLPMAPIPSPVFIQNGQVVYGTPATPDPTGQKVTINPGFPFFIPGKAGARPPHPPFDFAPDGSGGFMDGGLPRHIVTGGSIKFESHDLLDWSKDLDTAIATQLPEEGTAIEKVAIDFFSKRCHETPFPDGTPSNCTALPKPIGFIVNGLPLGPQLGAPFADPAVDDDGKPVNFNPGTKQQRKRIYKAAAVQMNVVFNKQGWHFPQQRFLTLWNDVAKTFDGTRPTEPLFFRGNSGDIIEYWHTNLVPNYYQVDDFQVRTPTDILGQHIHLVKFDVTSSDGAGNGFNYEDGTFSPEEVQEVIAAIKKPGGSWTPCPGCTPPPPGGLEPKPPPSQICSVPNPPAQCAHDWLGAQTTIQRWYIDPLLDNSGDDRTMRTVFTHDHFGPSTHQQAGLYAGLLIEPKDSVWTSNDGAETFGSRADGGPTSWQARIITKDTKDSYREFMLEFQDLQLAYQKLTLYPDNKPNPNPRIGFIDSKNAINAPGGTSKAAPSLITTGIPIIPAGTQSVNYRNEPLAFRLLGSSFREKFGDLSFAYDNAIQDMVPGAADADPDPMTPLMRAYENDKVQIRILVGAHVFAHQFTLQGPTWFSEPAWKNSGYRSTQAMGLSEHFELLFNVPSSSAPNIARQCPDKKSNVNCVDYLYSPSMDESGLANGLWGLFRAYAPNAKPNDPIRKLIEPLPNNSIVPGTNTTYTTCPAGAVPKVFNITAVTAEKALSGLPSLAKQIVFNSRSPLGGGQGDTLTNTLGIMYVRSEDLDASGVLNSGVPVEPLILRANAGDCIEVNLTNAIQSGDAAHPNDDSLVFKADFPMAAPTIFDPNVPGAGAYPHKVSRWVGLRPQLLSFDQATSAGVNIGWNSVGQPDQAIPFKETKKYTWYAGKIERPKNGPVTHTAVEFGSLNLFASDPLFAQKNGLFGMMIIEPAEATWQCGEPGSLGNCDPPGAAPTTRASATITLQGGAKFREFALIMSDNLIISPNPGGGRFAANSNAVNYRTEPWRYRYPPANTTQDFSCMASNQLVTNVDPQTPIFRANPGDGVRFRLVHTFGTGTSQVFSLHGHSWQRNPYQNDSNTIGNNTLSQWLGSRDNYGSTDHADLVIDKAGGEFKKTGDYLYTAFAPNQAFLGQWGLFQVGPDQPNPPKVNVACIPTTGPAPAAEQKDDLQRFVRQPTGVRP